MKAWFIAVIGALAFNWVPNTAFAQEGSNSSFERQERLRQERLGNHKRNNRSDDIRYLYDLRRRSDVARQERRARQSAPGMRSQPANGGSTRGSVVRTE